MTNFSNTERILLSMILVKQFYDILQRPNGHQGWYTFRRQLSYKQNWRGGELLLVNSKNTSITCPNCECIRKENRRTQSLFECAECGYQNHADLVGAINIVRAGHAQLACGVVPRGATVKQESTKAAA